MKPYPIGAPRTQRLLWHIDVWMDDADAGLVTEKDVVLDEATRHTTMSGPIELWGSQLGELRQLARDLRRVAPEATETQYYLDRKIETYTGHVGSTVRHRLDFRTETVDTGDNDTETGVVHGPAGRDIAWGCTPIPRFDHS